MEMGCDANIPNNEQMDVVDDGNYIENLNNEQKPFGTLSVSQDIFANHVKSENNEYCHEILYDYKTNSDRYFCCELCLVWFFDISELLIHISDEHEYLKISEEIQRSLFRQWEEVLKIEKTILELIAVKKFNSAKRTLKSNIETLNNIQTNLFSPKTNVFKHFIESMQSRLKLLVKEGKINTANELKKLNVLPENFNSFAKKGKLFIKSDKNKDRKVRKKKQNFMKDDVSVNFLSDFSSEDDLCLKDTIKNMEQDITSNIKVEDNISVESDECPQLEEMTYYIIPEREDGKAINVVEMGLIHTALKDILKKKNVNLDLFSSILLRRYNIELDEVLPDGAIIVSEWISPETKYEIWNTMTFPDFLDRNVSKKHKNNASSSDNLQNDSDDDETNDFSIDDSNIGESLEVKIEENSNELNITNNDRDLFSYQQDETVKKQINNEFKCQTCGIIFTYKGKLLQHELRFHSKSLENRSQTYNKIKFSKDSYDAPECNVCFRKFTSVGRLTQHMDIAHGGKVFLKHGRKKNTLPEINNDDVNLVKTSDE